MYSCYFDPQCEKSHAKCRLGMALLVRIVDVQMRQEQAEKVSR